MSRYVSYYRVSSQKQSRSGLGLDAQKSAVINFIKDGELIAEFTEVESGRNSDRPKLKEAIALARKSKSILIIAKLDRLSRNLAFIANILDANIEFIVADMPSANKMMLQMMGVIAEFEAKQISERTKVALQQAKARGTILGNRTNWKEAQAKAHQTLIDQADKFAENMLPIIKDISHYERSSVHKVADTLNTRGIQSRRGGLWTGSAVLNIIKRNGYAGLKMLANS